MFRYYSQERVSLPAQMIYLNIYIYNRNVHTEAPEEANFIFIRQTPKIDHLIPQVHEETVAEQRQFYTYLPFSFTGLLIDCLLA